jgi:nucleotide-binding universal stress UspA family protein
MMIKRILVPMDFSSHAERALEYAVEMAKPFKAEVAVVHVFEPIYYAAPDLAGAGPALGAIIDEQQKSARAQLQRLEARYAKRRVALRGFLQTGPPAPAIGDTAKRFKADLIVMGTHGRTGLAHVLLGSVAEQVVRTAPCPVLTLRAATKRGAKRRR